MNDVALAVPEPSDPNSEMARMTARLHSACEETTPGRYSISSRSAPTDGERRALTRRADELRACMTPAEAEDIAREALKLMAGYPSLRLTHEEAARTAATFVAALAGMPLWAIRKACLDWACGRVQGSNPAFPPSAPELRLATNKAAAIRQHEVGTIEVILKAEVERLPTDEERAKALAYWHDTVRPTLQHADVTDTVNPMTSREEQIRANDRVRQRERQQVGASPAGTRTPEMDRYLAQMRAEYGIEVEDDDAEYRPAMGR